MGATLIRTAMLKITSDDGDTEAKLAKISAQADELARKHPDLTPRINTAAASAKLKVLKAELADTSHQADETGGRFSALKEAVNGLTLGLPSGYGEMNMFQKAIVAVNLATGVAEPAIAGLTVAAGGLAAGIVAAGAGLGVFGIVAKSIWTQVTTAVTAYQAAQAAAGSATTGKARTAALKQEQAALAGLTGDQRHLAMQVMSTEGAWHKFVSTASPGVTGVIAQGLGLIPRVLSLIQPFLAPVEGALRQLLTELGSALWSKGASDFAKMLSGQTEPAIYMLGHAIGNIATGLGGILKAFMPASQGILAGVDKITARFASWGTTLSSHSGFKSLQVMAKTDAPLLISALQRLGSIAKIVGSQMSSMTGAGNSKQFLQLANVILKATDAVLKWNPQLVTMGLYAKMAFGAFGKLRTGITGVSGGISDIKKVTAAMGDLKKGVQGAEVAEGESASAWQNFGGTLAGIGGKIKGAGAGAKTAAAAIGSGITSGLSSAKAGVITLASNIGTGLKTAALGAGNALKSAALAVKEFGIGSKIAAAATKIWTVVQAAFDIVMDANPIMLIIIAIGLLVAAIVFLVVKFKPVRDFFKAAWKDIENAFVSAWHFIDNDMIHPLMSGIGTLVDWVKSHFKLLAVIISTVLFGPIGFLVSFVITHWNQIKTETGKLITGVVGFFKSLPGKIMSAIESLPGLMLKAGANIIHALANGIKSAVGSVLSAVGNVGHDIANAVTHPFGIHFSEPSEATQMIKAGMRITQGLSTGMIAPSAMASARAAAAHVGQVAMITGGGGAAAAGGAMGGVMTIDASSSDPVIRALVTQLQNHIRVTFGGNVERALGRG